ncbi:phage tail terminator-like protein [Psychrobacter arcticus]|uniref:phage tail terminator-like protein n=1 Tax=Psychrobacter arcticus TaxID=334543 RepID=UPI00164FEC45|nr:phage tail terminator-like protein [Psychrobacter arcticus]
MFLPLFQLKLLHHRSGDLENRGHLRDIEQACILQITLFVPIGTNISVIDAKADAIRAKFGTEQSHTVDGHNVLIRSSHKEPAMPDSDGKWYMQPISIEYQII